MVKREENIFLLKAHGTYWVDAAGIEHKISQACVFANGVGDLCIYRHGPEKSDVGIGKTAEIVKERILSVPMGDILWMEFEKTLADGTKGFFIDVASDPTVKDLVTEILRRFGGKKGSEYAMYGGDQYLSEDENAS
jgi:hypothetical protein